MRRPAVAALAAGVVLTCTAVGAPQHAAAATDSTIEAIILSWEETPGEVIELESELLGHLTVVPGAHQERVLLVRNAGPSQATLTVSVVNASAATDGPEWVDDEFYDDLRVMGVPAAQLAGQDTVVLSTDIAQGGAVPVPLIVEFPSAATSGNTAQVGPREFAFDVRLRLSGPGADPGGRGPDDGGVPARTSTTPSGVPGSATRYLTPTGGAVTETDWALLMAAAAALAVAGHLARRRPLAVVRTARTRRQ